MKWLAIATAIGFLVACGGSSGVSSPTGPTPPVTSANLGGSAANIAGSYHGTITASSMCSASLSPEMRVLGFTATVTQNDAAVQVQLSAGASPATVAGTISGQTVTFPSFSFSGVARSAGVALVTTVTLAATGGNAGIAADGSLAGTLSGTYQTPSGPCDAVNHQLQMVKSNPGSPRP